MTQAERSAKAKRDLEDSGGRLLNKIAIRADANHELAKISARTGETASDVINRALLIAAAEPYADRLRDAVITLSNALCAHVLDVPAVVEAIDRAPAAGPKISEGLGDEVEKAQALLREIRG